MRLVGSVLVAAGVLGIGLVSRAQAPEEGIRWAEDLKRTLHRARLENRPVLVAINALDDEAGNRFMAFRAYRDRSLVETTGFMFCLVASPSTHGGKICPRFGSIPCRAHKDVLTYALARFGNQGDLISPQHVILAPDGSLLWRQEFMIQPAELRRECERALVRTAPRHALGLAEETRAGRMERLRQGADAEQYLRSGDPLAPAVLLLLWEETEQERWLAPLRHAPKESFGLVRLYLRSDPALLPVARAIDPQKGAWWKEHLQGPPAEAPPPHDPALRKAYLALQQGDRSGLEDLLAAIGHPVDGPEVRAALARLAGGDQGPRPDGWREHFGG